MAGHGVQVTMSKLVDQATSGVKRVDMETEYLNLGLDIIGLGVFNYDFGSITSESPVIKVSVPAQSLKPSYNTQHTKHNTRYSQRALGQSLLGS